MVEIYNAKAGLSKRGLPAVVPRGGVQQSAVEIGDGNGSWEIGIHSFCHLILVQKLEFRSGVLAWAETARIRFSGTAAGLGVMAHLQAHAEPAPGHGAAKPQPKPN
jgi:hypothetical protein